MAIVPSAVKEQVVASAPEFSILDCPICLEHFRQPKSLPCLHTFCQECLSTFITNRVSKGSKSHPTFFPCPVCRRNIQPIEPLSNPNVWSGHFPTNNFVVEMLKKESTSLSKKQVCRPCEKRKKETSASFWCKDCAFFLCDTCKNGHDMVLDDHEQFAVDELLEHPNVFAQQDINLCVKHSEKSDLFCVDHGSIGCHKCIAVEHRKCDNVTTVTEYFSDLQCKDQLQDINTKLETRVKDLDVLIQDSRSKLDMITQDKNSVLHSLSEYQALFNKMISDLNEDMMKIYKEEEEKIRGHLEALEILRSSLLQTKSMSTSFSEIGNENQLLSTVLRGNSEMQLSDDIVKERTAENERVRFSLKLNKDVVKLKTQMKIGKIEVQKERGSTLDTSVNSSMFGRKAVQAGTITVPVPPRSSSIRITGMIALPNNSLVVVDFSNNRLVHLTETSQVIGEVKLDGSPWTLCCMPDGHYAVSLWNCNIINLVQLSPLKCIGKMQLTSSPYGVAYFKGSLYATFPDEINKPLCRISTDCEINPLFTFDSNDLHIACRNMDGSLVGTLHHSLGNKSKTAVYSVSPSLVLSEVIKADVVKEAYGIDTDDEDNIYVCGRNSHNVVQVSADGFRTRELLTSADVSTPESVSVCGDRLYVSQGNNKQVKIYTLV